MGNLRRSVRAHRYVGGALALVLLSSFVVTGTTFAAATVSPANATISADTSTVAPGGGSFTTLSGPTFTEGAAADITPGGNVVLTLTGSYVFDTGGVAPTAVMTAPAGTCSVTATSPAVVTSTTVTTTLGGSATATTNRCKLTFSGIRVKPTSGTVPNVGTIKVTYTSAAAINGAAGGSTVGTLTMVPGAASSANMAFATQPSATATGGTAFAQQPAVHVRDQFNNDIPGASVTLSKTPGTGAAAGVVSCTANPIATGSPAYTDAQFAGCSIDLVGSNYKLRATSGSAFVDSSPINVTVGVPHHLVFSSYPASTTPSLLAPQPAVQVVDAGGNVTNDTRNITLSANQNDAQLTCTGGKTRPAVSGTATFAGCTETVVATGYTLTATTTGLSSNSVTGAVFSVTSGPANKLLLCWGTATVCNTTPPAPITGGTAFTTQPVIRVVDVNNNIVTTDNTTVVTLSILPGTPTSGGPGTLTCTGPNTATVVAGVATFAGCKIDKAGTNYRLNAASTPSVTAAQSNVFNVTVGPAIKLGFVTQPPASASANTAFPADIQVAIQDAGGNTVTTGITATIALTIGVNPSGGTLTCNANTATTTNGVATFQACRINNQGNGYTLVATTVATAPLTTLTSATSNTFNVLAPLAAITLTAPTVITWGDDMTLHTHFGVNGAAKAFTIQVSKDGLVWSNITGASLTSNGSGDADFVYGPSDNRYYRVSFAGTPDLQAGFSNVVRTVVRQTNSLRPSHSGYQSLSHGTQIQFKSTVRPNRPELPQPVVNFVVYQLKSTGWTKVLDQMVPTDRNPASSNYGRATLFITFNSVGKFYVRSQAVPTTLNANSGWSAAVRYNVI